MFENQNVNVNSDDAAVFYANGTLEKGNVDGSAMPQNQSDAEGGLSSKAPGESMTKAEDEDEDDEDEEEEKEGMKKRKMKGKSCKKSDVNHDDLIKALDQLEATANGLSGDSNRRIELAGKLADGVLTKSEKEELSLLVATNESEDDLSKSLSDSWAENDNLGEDYDVSPFLEKLGNGIATSLDYMRQSLNKSMNSQNDFNRSLATSLRGIGQLIVDQAQLIKSLQQQNDVLSKRLGVVENTPMGRKTVANPSTPHLQKSFAGNGLSELSKEQINQGLDLLLSKSQNNDWLAPCGESLEHAIAKFETGGVISRPLYNDIKAVLSQ